jgi:hypothetical protein
MIIGYNEIKDKSSTDENNHHVNKGEDIHQEPSLDVSCIGLPFMAR